MCAHAHGSLRALKECLWRLLLPLHYLDFWIGEQERALYMGTCPSPSPPNVPICEWRLSLLDMEGLIGKSAKTGEILTPRWAGLRPWC
jgi:hypothetical protein